MRTYCALLLILFTTTITHAQSAEKQRDYYQWKEIKIRLNGYDFYESYDTGYNEKSFRQGIGIKHTNYSTGTANELAEWGPTVFHYEFKRCKVHFISNQLDSFDFYDSTISVNGIRVGDSISKAIETFKIGKKEKVNQKMRYKVKISDASLTFHYQDNTITRIDYWILY